MEKCKDDLQNLCKVVLPKTLKGAAKKAVDGVVSGADGTEQDNGKAKECLKEKLEKKTDDKIRKMGAAYKGLVKKMAKVVKKKHNIRMADLKKKKQADNTGV